MKDNQKTLCNAQGWNMKVQSEPYMLWWRKMGKRALLLQFSNGRVLIKLVFSSFSQLKSSPF